MKWSLTMVGLALLPAATMSAQVVRGAVVDARDGTSMGAVVVQLLDATGTVVGRTMSDERGQFRLVAPGPGAHRIRTLRIGFRPATSDVLQLAAGQDVEPRIALTPVPLELAAVTVSARNACRIYADAGAAAELWDQARTAFTAARLSAAERRVAVGMTTYHRELEPGTEAVLTQQVDAQSGFTTRPFVSLPPDSLRKAGYVVASPDGWTIYYAPDLDVLASDVFLGDHCLRIASEDSAQIGIAFEPTRDRGRVPEIAGTVWLDRRTLELRRMEFAYVNVSRVHRDVASGGHMQFLRVGNLWAISSWFIRMPVITRHAEFGRSPEERVAKLRVSGGDLMFVRRGADTLWRRPALTFRLALTDSTSGDPVVGAQVEVRGTQLVGITDSTGRSSIPGMLPGVYVLHVASPAMKALGMSHEARLAIIDPRETHRIRLPSLDYTLDRMCPHLKPRDGIIMGRVRASGDSAPPGALTVFARWELISLKEVPGGVITTRIPQFAETTTDVQGAFTLCGVPTVTALTMLTAWNERGPGTEVRIDGPARVVRVDLTATRPR